MKLRTHIKKNRHILTTSGKLDFIRYILIPSDKASADRLYKLNHAKTVAPMDEMLQIDDLPFNMTVQVMLQIAYQGAVSSSYKEAAENINRRFGFVQDGSNETDNESYISVSRVREVTNYIGKMVYMEDCRKARRAKWEYDNSQLKFKNEDKDILYIMTDGAALNTRHKEKIDEDNESSWRENKLCVAFRTKNVRTQEIKKDDGSTEYRRFILKREYCSYTGSINEFKWHVFALAIRCGYGQTKQIVIVSDGAEWIVKLRKELFPDAVHILDLYHAKERIHEYSKAVFSDSSKAEAWAKKTCEKLEEGKWQEILTELEQFKNITLPKNVVNLATYLGNHSDMLDYPTYFEKKYIVGSGIIECGHKVVQQPRLNGPGMRWNVPTARYLLALRTKIKSGLWERNVVLFITNRMINLKIIPPRLPRSEEEVQELEEKEIEEEKKAEKTTWKKKRIR